jgi:hypothetical protein
MRKNTGLIILAALLMPCSSLRAQPRATANDFKLMEACWDGQLTYLDYSTGKPYTMSARVTVEKMRGGDQWLFDYEYPGEPQARQRDTVVLSEDGRKWGDLEVVSRKKKKGSLLLEAQKEDVDGNDQRPATIRYRYHFDQNRFSITKEVLFKGTDSWILRSKYEFEKIDCALMF